MQRLKLPKVQAAEVTYELHSLGWKAFQNLCVTITGEVWGQIVQSFFDSHDGGRDGAFYGTWKPMAGESFQGSFTAQCKFTAKTDKSLHLSDLKDELANAQSLASRGLSDNWITTFFSLTPVLLERLKTKSEKHLKQFLALSVLHLMAVSAFHKLSASHHDSECWFHESMD